jgi:hypothetical protein
MLVTEQEARELFCPHAFVIMGKKDMGEDVYTCKASGCMSWNWFDQKKRGSEHKGYCGLAGRPLSADW